MLKDKRKKLKKIKLKKLKIPQPSPQPSTSNQEEEDELSLEDFITQAEIDFLFGNFSDNNFAVPPDTPDATPMNSQEPPQNDAPKSVGATSNGTSNTASSAMGSTINSINYIVNPYMPLNKTAMYTRTRILTTWGNANFFKENTDGQIKKNLLYRYVGYL